MSKVQEETTTVVKPLKGGSKRSWDVENVLNKKFKGLPFDGIWKEVFGQPERAHSWIIYGRSSSGKTTFNMQLVKYLSQFERVLYNSLEEGLSASIQTAYNRVGITNQNKVTLVQESMKDLTARLEKHKSPNIVFIDSVRYTKMRWNDYQAFCQRFPNKLFIWVSHAKGKEPKGALANDIFYDAFVKIYTEGYRVFVSSRFTTGSESTMDIWKAGAAKYWGETQLLSN